jgi:hypothetical protein
MNGQTGILMDVHSVLQGITEVSQPQLPRPGPSGQPIESSQLDTNLPGWYRQLRPDYVCGMEWFMERSAFKMGSYRAGALWCVKELEGKYITFNNVRIARQEEDGTWFTLTPGWKVTPAGSIDVHVQLNNGDGVVLPYRWGRSKRGNPFGQDWAANWGFVGGDPTELQTWATATFQGWEGWLR